MRRALPIAGHGQAAHAAASPNQGATPTGLSVEPVLDLDDIQGNILAGFNKDYQTFLFLRIDDRAGAKAWLRSMAPRISNTAEVLAFNRLFRAMRAARGHDPHGLVATWINIAFSADGLRKLTSDAEVEQFLDDPFKLGLQQRSGLLGDPGDPNSPGHVSQWLVGGSAGKIADIVLTMASDGAPQLTRLVEAIESELQKDFPGLSVLFKQEGATLPGELRGHEHFGFKDGISQPGVRGRASQADNDFVTPRWIDRSDPQSRIFSRPGQPLVWPGQFVFGYAGQNPRDPVEPTEADTPRPSWSHNGSLLVIRRLRQDVIGFRAWLETAAADLAKQPGFTGMTGIRLGALLVGRWPSGAPVMRTPKQDNPKLADDDFANNQFQYVEDTPPVRLVPIPGHAPDSFPQASADSSGAVCPIAAHIRKVNPRDTHTDQGGANDTFARLILRRGIPFGPATAWGTVLEDAPVDRGLMFVSYQTSIDNQFEFLSRIWVNDPNEPNPGGVDPVIGQFENSGTRARDITLFGENGATATVTLPRDFIIPSGGGYFFAPSLSALRTVLAAEGAPKESGFDQNGLQDFSIHADDDHPWTRAVAGAKPAAASDPETAARAYLANAFASTDLPEFNTPLTDGRRSEFRLLGVEAWPATKTQTVKFRQLIRHVPVYGSLVTVELTTAGEFVALSATLGLPSGVEAIAQLAPAAVFDILIRRSGANPNDIARAPYLAYYFDESHHEWRLVYIAENVPLRQDVPGAIPQIMDYIVDAQNGDIVAELRRTQGAQPEQLDVVDAAGQQRKITALHDAGAYRLEDPIANVRTHDLSFRDFRAAPSCLPGDAVAKPPEWNPAAVSAHANGAEVMRFLSAMVGRRGVDGRGSTLVSSINCLFGTSGSQEWKNASWLPNIKQMVYGQRLVAGQMRSYAVAKEIVAHEIFHGVTAETACLAYEGMTGALNESYSDIFGIIFVNAGEPDIARWNWGIGAELGESGEALRDFSDPARLGQPAHMNDYRDLPFTEAGDFGAVHANSGIHNKAAYLIMTARNAAGEYLFFIPYLVALFYQALAMQLSHTSKFTDSRRAITLVAKSLNRVHPGHHASRLRAIDAAFESVGIG